MGATDTTTLVYRAQDHASSVVDKILKRLDVLKRKGGAIGFFAGITAAATLKGLDLVGRALDGVVDFLGDSIAAASNLNETITKSRVIFGDGADAIEAWAGTAAKAFGQSKRQALDTASGFAGLFQTVGLAAEESAANAQELTKLGSDLASFFNTDVQQALDALRSGLSGESEPLRKFNVFLSETAVSAKLAQLGVKKVGGVFTEAQKATARYALIMEQTGSAQGDFARTSDGLANKQRIANAALEDAQAVLGEKLLPAQLALTDAMIAATPVIETLAEALALVVDAAGSAKGAIDAFNEALHNPTGNADVAAAEDALFAYLEGAQTGMAAAGTAVEGFGVRLDAVAGKTLAAKAAADDLADSQDDLSSFTNRARRAAERHAEELDAVKDAADDLRGSIDLLGDEMFGEVILAGQVAAAQARVNEVLKTGPETKKAQDVAIWRGELAEAKADLIELQGQLALSKGPETFSAWLATTKKGIGDNDAALLSLIRRIEGLAKIAGTLPAGSTGGFTVRLQALQHGGPAEAGRPYIVGERGPEVFIPRTDGEVIPSHSVAVPRTGGGAGGGGAPVVLQLKLPNGRVLTELVDKHLYYRRAAAPS